MIVTRVGYTIHTLPVTPGLTELEDWEKQHCRAWQAESSTVLQAMVVLFGWMLSLKV